MNDQEILGTVMAALDRRQAVALVTVTAGTGIFADRVGLRQIVVTGLAQQSPGDLLAPQLGEQILRDVHAALAARTPRSAVYQAGSDFLQVFIDIQTPPPHLLIIGAGHIAAPLAEIGRICEFEVTVLDDRPQYANRQRFPHADRVIAGTFTEELRRLRRGQPTFDENYVLVLVTRGHQYDVACLLEVLDDPVAYIGMIGSQRRFRAVYELLEPRAGRRAGEARPHPCTHRPEYRGADAGRDRRLYHGRNHQCTAWHGSRHGRRRDGRKPQRAAAAPAPGAPRRQTIQPTIILSQGPEQPCRSCLKS